MPLAHWWCVVDPTIRGSLGDMKIDVVVASISCLGKFPTNHVWLHPTRSNYRVSRRPTKNRSGLSS